VLLASERLLVFKSFRKPCLLLGLQPGRVGRAIAQSDQSERTRPMAGIDSMMKNHCHPARPAVPSIASSSSETCEPNEFDIGITTMKVAAVRKR